MKRSWKQWLAVACLAAVALPALAQSKNDELVITGKDWLSASMAERKAFLVGVANLIMAEGAHARKQNRSAPPVSAGITKAAEPYRISEVEARVTRWYEANPGRVSRPVMAVLYQDLAK